MTLAWWLKLCACMILYVSFGVFFSGQEFQWYHAITYYMIGLTAAIK